MKDLPRHVKLGEDYECYLTAAEGNAWVEYAMASPVVEEFVIASAWSKALLARQGATPEDLIGKIADAEARDLAAHRAVFALAKEWHAKLVYNKLVDGGQAPQGEGDPLRALRFAADALQRATYTITKSEGNEPIISIFHADSLPFTATDAQQAADAAREAAEAALGDGEPIINASPAPPAGDGQGDGEGTEEQS